jgi:uridine monophosphate synthetase
MENKRRIDSPSPGFEFSRIAGIPFTGLPIAVAVSLGANYPMVFGRRESKEYGVSRQIEGSFNQGERVLIIDDVITDGQSKMEYVKIFINNGLVVRDILVFLDREQGGQGNMARHGITLHAVCTMTRLLESLRSSGSIDEDRYRLVHDFLRERR